tara:strand:+ start:293 stop:502 length:210 start_codon:yes stop_codon:yes gene_type:complete
MLRFLKLSETFVSSSNENKLFILDYILNDCNGFQFKKNHGFSKYSFVKHFANFKFENGLFKIINLKGGK